MAQHSAYTGRVRASRSLACRSIDETLVEMFKWVCRLDVRCT